MGLRIETYSRKRFGRRRQYHARVICTSNRKQIWRTSEGYNNRGERDAAIHLLIDGLGPATPIVEVER